MFLGSVRSLTEAGGALSIFEWASLALDVVPAFLTGLVALALFFSLRSHREYLFLAFYALANSALHIALVLSWIQPYGIHIMLWLWCIGSAVIIAFVEFIRQILGLRRTWLIFLLELLIVAGQITSPLWALGYLPFATASSGDLSFLFIYLTLAVRLFNGARHGGLHRPGSSSSNFDVQILFLSIVPTIAAEIRDVLAELFFASAADFASPSFRLGPFAITYDTLADLILELALLAFLVTRTVRIARERNRVAAEIEAAQSVQQLLLVRSSIPLPGFDVQSVYLPASEVGGDFFLVSPDPSDGSLIAILGDVSGKGLTAAMRVAMILGILRRESSRDPATILLRLNHALLSQDDVGFTTACCVRLCSSGAFTVSNAGHISPYINGTEIVTSPSLPLGLASNQEYDELRGQLPPGSRIVLMSDGVVEARSKTGELYGFDRLAALTLSPAKEIASVAQAFGQDDDITVLTVACVA